MKPPANFPSSRAMSHYIKWKVEEVGWKCTQHLIPEWWSVIQIQPFTISALLCFGISLPVEKVSRNKGTVGNKDTVFLYSPPPNIFLFLLKNQAMSLGNRMLMESVLSGESWEQDCILFSCSFLDLDLSTALFLISCCPMDHGVPSMGVSAGTLWGVPMPLEKRQKRIDPLPPPTLFQLEPSGEYWSHIRRALPELGGKHSSWMWLSRRFQMR